MVNLKNRPDIELWLVNIVKKKIIATSIVIAFLVTFYVQSVATAYTPLPGVTITAWTDKAQYAPGERGKLKISILNSLDKPVDVNEIYIEYPWFTYNAEGEGAWEGNATITGEPLATIPSKGGDYYTEVEFTVPNDGRIAGLSSAEWYTISIDVETSEGKAYDFPAGILAMGTTLNMAVADIDTWMTILTAAIVICTIILAAVIFLTTRTPRMPVVAPRAKA